MHRKFALSRRSQQAVGNNRRASDRGGRPTFALGFLFLAPGESNTPRRPPPPLPTCSLRAPQAIPLHAARDSYTCIPKMSGGRAEGIRPVSKIGYFKSSMLGMKIRSGFPPLQLSICPAISNLGHSPSRRVRSLLVGVPLGFGAREAAPLPPAAGAQAAIAQPEAEGGHAARRPRPRRRQWRSLSSSSRSAFPRGQLARSVPTNSRTDGRRGRRPPEGVREKTEEKRHA